MSVAIFISEEVGDRLNFEDYPKKCLNIFLFSIFKKCTAASSFISVHSSAKLV